MQSIPIFNWTSNRLIDTNKLVPLMPSFDRYIEPFVGGGRVYSALDAKATALLNDIDPFVISFYKELQNESSHLKQEIDTLIADWETIERFFTFVKADLETVTQDLKEQILTIQDVPYVLRTIFALNMHQPDFESLFDIKNIIDQDTLIELLIQSCIGQYKRIKCTTFEPISDVTIKNGYFNHLRYLNNNWEHYKKVANKKRLAIWYFVNLLSDTARISYSNIEKVTLPFPKNAPTTKELKKEITRIFSSEIKTLISNTTFSNLDYKAFITTLYLTPDDFVFLDPPFNAKYIHYEHDAFNPEEYTQLAEVIATIPSKWMLLIKESDFNRALYKHTEIFVKKAPLIDNNDFNLLIITNYSL